ncbi:hypothetical protein U0027_25270 (plasmid) [Agrobacterium tumefaciens]|uniref:hypothetical protein n=1 Tax=Agrobacterium tumefaciens TaxID=358 RepID=UPI0013B3CED3|nr:hypothetical protein [Agrobacterium tumefaciens]WQE43349.1 hypothetical protein U0027_25270 [Agrobacterium tumefaciens]
MAIYKGALALLGKSETDAAVVDYLKSLGATLPLERPPRGEKETNVEAPGQQIELVFTLGSELPKGTRFAEGELVLRTFFILPEEAGRSIDGTPFDLDMTMTREQARAKFGEPEWSSRGSLKNDRWGLETSGCFCASLRTNSASDKCRCRNCSNERVPSTQCPPLAVARASVAIS